MINPLTRMPGLAIKRSILLLRIQNSFGHDRWTDYHSSNNHIRRSIWWSGTSSTGSKSKAAGATVNEVIADTAYSTLENLKDAQSNDYKLISKLNPSIIKGTRSEDGFIFNKDADTMQCPAGHLAIKYRIDKRSNQKRIHVSNIFRY